MNDKILYLGVITSFLGLMLLTYASHTLEPELIDIGAVNTKYLEKNVHIQGDITTVQYFKGGSVLLVLDDQTGQIDIYLPRNLAEDINKKWLVEGQLVEVIGTVKLYKGRLEVEPESYDGVKFI